MSSNLKSYSNIETSSGTYYFVNHLGSGTTFQVGSFIKKNKDNKKVKIAIKIPYNGIYKIEAKNEICISSLFKSDENSKEFNIISSSKYIYNGLVYLREEYENVINELKLVNDYELIKDFYLESPFISCNLRFYEEITLTNKYKEEEKKKKEKEKRIDKNKDIIFYKWSESEIIKLALDILNALNFLHKKNIIHRDIKPENILYDEINNKFLLTDFGSISCIENDKSLRKLTMFQVVTLWYRSPNILEGSYNYGKEIDLYSLGCTLIEMICGDALFKIADETLSLIEKKKFEEKFIYNNNNSNYDNENISVSLLNIDNVLIQIIINMMNEKKNELNDNCTNEFLQQLIEKQKLIEEQQLIEKQKLIEEQQLIDKKSKLNYYSLMFLI
jgi:serine/threonine protein kinase